MNAEFYCGMCGATAIAEKGDVVHCLSCDDKSNGSMVVKMMEKKETEDAQ